MQIVNRLRSKGNYREWMSFLIEWIKLNGLDCINSTKGISNNYFPKNDHSIKDYAIFNGFKKTWIALN